MQVTVMQSAKLIHLGYFLPGSPLWFGTERFLPLPKRLVSKADSRYR